MLEKYRLRAWAGAAGVARGAIGGVGLVGFGRSGCRLHYRGAFGAAIVAGLLLIGVGAAPQPAPAPDQRQPPETPGATPETEPVEQVKLEGFRSARWGMDAAQVKAAIQKDFAIAADKVKTEENAAERTTILTVTVNDILEGAGPARVSYVLGFKTKKLIQVTILWGTPVDPQAHPDKIVAAANQLRQLFLDSGYQPDCQDRNPYAPPEPPTLAEVHRLISPSWTVRLGTTVRSARLHNAVRHVAGPCFL